MPSERRFVGVAVLGACAASCAGILGMDEVAILPSADGGVSPTGDGAAGDAPPGFDAGGSDAPVDAGCTGEACERYVFVTSSLLAGGLGGAPGADAVCQARADASPLSFLRGRRFAAWLSAGPLEARDRLAHGTLPYRRVDGAVVAANWAELASASHQASISIDETGKPSGDTYVWTGTNVAGYAAVNHCDHWSTGTAVSDGTVGLALAKDGRWTAGAIVNCSSPARLYCLER